MIPSDFLNVAEFPRGVIERINMGTNVSNRNKKATMQAARSAAVM